MVMKDNAPAYLLVKRVMEKLPGFLVLNYFGFCEGPFIYHDALF